MPPPFKVAIPARYASTRLPGKPLLPIAGRPMIAHVCERALEAGAEEVIVATDDRRIQRAVAALGVRSVMTRADHLSGTERIAEAADICGWADRTLIVNLQGDEPLLSPLFIRAVAAALAGHDKAQMATLCAPIRAKEDIFNPHVVKVVLDRFDYALYFSRAPIPWDREAFDQRAACFKEGVYYRHIGLYAYSAGFLREYVKWPSAPLETVERLEQLRVLWQGEPIYVLKVASAPEAGVDTEADLKRIESMLARTEEASP